jgi:hypothetical protein
MYESEVDGWDESEFLKSGVSLCVGQVMYSWKRWKQCYSIKKVFILNYVDNDKNKSINKIKLNGICIENCLQELNT